MNPLMSQGHPLELRGAQDPLRLCRDLGSALGCQRTTHQVFPAALGTSHASDSGDGPLEKHFQQAELSGNILLLKGSPKL